MTSVAFVKQSVSTVVEGRPVRLTKNDAWDADDIVVKSRPDLFSDLPERLLSSNERVSAPVEQATAEPGEVRRGPGRPKKAAGKAD